MEIKTNNWKIWLICSAYAIDETELPKTLCKFVKMFIMALISIPFAWSSHIVNLIFRKTDMSAGWGFAAQILGMIITAAIFEPTRHPDAYALISQYSTGEQLLLCYAVGPFATLAGLLAFAIMCLCCAHFIFGWDMLNERWQGNKEKEWFTNPHTTMFWVAEIYRSIKNKYCVKIKYTKDEKF